MSLEVAKEAGIVQWAKKVVTASIQETHGSLLGHDFRGPTKKTSQNTPRNAALVLGIYINRRFYVLTYRKILYWGKGKTRPRRVFR